jgi:hypothetical protein
MNSRSVVLGGIAILVSVPPIVQVAAATMDSSTILLTTLAILVLVSSASPAWGLLRRYLRPMSLRWKLRSFMLFIGLLGSCLGIRARGASFQRLAEYHAQKAEDSRPPIVRGITVNGVCFTQRYDEEPYRRRMTYHLAMAEKYRWAASHPWLPVAPEPPEPE